ncbi:MAG TPA: hypothetical protein VMY77_00720 [Chitinophagaceae bacterium]|nr:hypothetical protein [Chitinophagaceae bacterium]
MGKKSNNPHDDAHDQPPRDEVTKNKIDKHLSDIDDTISEQDIKNINTGTGADTSVPNHKHDIDEANEIIKDGRNEDDEPEKEAPSSWEILGE